MATGNLFLGYANGKIGSVVFYNSGGQQVSRAYNPSPSNPQSALQLLQRVIFKTQSAAYSLLRDICDHSFESFTQGTACQSEFSRLNVAQMRLQLADYVNSGDEEEILGCLETNFSAKDDEYPVLRPYVVSSGNLPTVSPVWASPSSGVSVPVIGSGITPGASYQEVAEALGLQLGDQITFMWLAVDDTSDSAQVVSFRFGRIILSPANGVPSTIFIDSNTGAINSPNIKNRGDYVCGYLNGGVYCVPSMNNATAGTKETIAATAVIISRETGGVWRRSPGQFVIRTSNVGVEGHLQWDHDTAYMADSIASYRKDSAVSTKYLNQAFKLASEGSNQFTFRTGTDDTFEDIVISGFHLEEFTHEEQGETPVVVECLVAEDLEGVKHVVINDCTTDRRYGNLLKALATDHFNAWAANITEADVPASFGAPILIAPTEEAYTKEFAVTKNWPELLRMGASYSIWV